MMNFLGRLTFLVFLPIFRLYLGNTKRVRVVLTSNDGYILLVKNRLSNQQWTLPGGGVKKNENDVAAGRRELLEETGIKIRRSQITAKSEFSYDDEDLRTTRTIVLMRANIENRVKIRRAWFELCDARWVKINNPPSGLSKMVTQVLSTNR